MRWIIKCNLIFSFFRISYDQNNIEIGSIVTFNMHKKRVWLTFHRQNPIDDCMAAFKHTEKKEKQQKQNNIIMKTSERSC